MIWRILGFYRVSRSIDPHRLIRQPFSLGLNDPFCLFGIGFLGPDDRNVQAETDQAETDQAVRQQGKKKENKGIVLLLSKKLLPLCVEKTRDKKSRWRFEHLMER
jgi:hypothetical protein